MLYIATLAEIKAELQIDDTAEDANLTLWMEAMQARFDNRTGRTLLHGAQTEILDGGTEKLYLHRFPVESVASLHCSLVGVFDDSTLYEAGIEYRLIPTRGEIIHGLYGLAPWPEGHANIQVVYTGGYYAIDAEDVPAGFAMPEDIRLAFFMQFTSLWRNRANLGIESRAKDGSSLSYGNRASIVLAGMTMLPEVEIILDKYMRFE